MTSKLSKALEEETEVVTDFGMSAPLEQSASQSITEEFKQDQMESVSSVVEEDEPKESPKQKEMRLSAKNSPSKRSLPLKVESPVFVGSPKSAASKARMMMLQSPQLGSPLRVPSHKGGAPPATVSKTLAKASPMATQPLRVAASHQTTPRAGVAARSVTAPTIASLKKLAMSPSRMGTPTRKVSSSANTPTMNSVARSVKRPAPTELESESRSAKSVRISQAPSPMKFKASSNASEMDSLLDLNKDAFFEQVKTFVVSVPQSKESSNAPSSRGRSPMFSPIKKGPKALSVANSVKSVKMTESMLVDEERASSPSQRRKSVHFGPEVFLIVGSILFLKCAKALTKIYLIAYP
jgi:hypothetical protein